VIAIATIPLDPVVTTGCIKAPWQCNLNRQIPQRSQRVTGS
jgi:hypothetical protein